MFKNLSQRVSRKRLNSKQSSYYSDLIASRNPGPSPGDYAHRSAGSVKPAAAQQNSPEEVSISAAGFHALDPQADQHVLQANGKHIFAAVLTQARPARGALYLRQHLYMEFLAQVSKHKSNMAAALQAALKTLNTDYTNLNPASQHLTEGVSLAVAFWSFELERLHIFSNGSCRCVVGKKIRNGQAVQIVADIGQSISNEAKEFSDMSDMRTLPFPRNAADTIVLGSAGFWQEVDPAAALLRGECFYQLAPKANASSAAAHLVNYGLHCVTERLKESTDLRMSSLKSVNNLVSLQAGDKSQFKWGSRQPVRRRRGDVHRDLTTVVMRIHWQGKKDSFEGDSKKTRQTLYEGASGQNLPRQSHWNLVRLHFVEFPWRLRQASTAIEHMAAAEVL